MINLPGTYKPCTSALLCAASEYLDILDNDVHVNEHENYIPKYPPHNYVVRTTLSWTISLK